MWRCDFELSDLRPEESDEPTRPIRTVTVHAAQRGRSGRTCAGRADGRTRCRSRSGDWKAAGADRRAGRCGAWLVVVVLFQTILGSFQAPAVDQYQVPDVLGMTVEEADERPPGEGHF